MAQANVLGMYGSKDQIYNLLPRLSKKSLEFMRHIQPIIEDEKNRITNENNQTRFHVVKSIEEHTSGINQMLKLNEKELVTASDDCYLKFWNSQHLKV